MRALHRSELCKFTPEALAEMCIDIMAILAEWDCIGLIHEAQAERRAAMMGEEEVDEPPPPAQFAIVAKPGAINAPNANARR